MSLANISQIKELKGLRSDVDLLLQSYEAAKVVTKIAKGENENYSVEELLAQLKQQLDSITGGEGQSLEALSSAINDLKNKPIKAFTGSAEEPVKEYKLSELPEDALLKSEELDITAYQDALDALVAKLAANKELIEAVKTLVGDTNVQAQIDAAIENVETALALKADKSEVEAVDAAAKVLATKVTELENNNVAMVLDIVALGAEQTVVPMSKEATDKLVRLYVNGAVYSEGEDFTVDRTAKTVNWTLEDFALNNDVAAKVAVKYFAVIAGAEPEPEPEPFDPSLIQVDESKIVLTREQPEKSFNVTIPADCTLEVVPSDPEAVEVTVTEVQ